MNSFRVVRLFFVIFFPFVVYSYTPTPHNISHPWGVWWYDSNEVFYDGPFEGSNSIASDPSVIVDPETGIYYMYYTCQDQHSWVPDGPQKNYPIHLICGASSEDGKNWTALDIKGGSIGQMTGAVLTGINGTYYKHFEGVGALYDPLARLGGKFVLFAGGFELYGGPSELIVAYSEDGKNFTIVDEENGPPKGYVLPRNNTWYDKYQVFSFSLMIDPKDPTNTNVFMIYTGHCDKDCTSIVHGDVVTSVFFTLGARSTDLLTWEKMGPILPWPDSIDNPQNWWSKFTGEPGWFFGDDGYYYVLFSSLINDPAYPAMTGGKLGIGRSENPFSGYVLSDNPIIVRDNESTISEKSVFAATARLNIVTNQVEVWYWQNGAKATVNFAYCDWDSLKVHEGTPVCDICINGNCVGTNNCTCNSGYINSPWCNVTIVTGGDDDDDDDDDGPELGEIILVVLVFGTIFILLLCTVFYCVMFVALFVVFLSRARRNRDIGLK